VPSPRRRPRDEVRQEIDVRERDGIASAPPPDDEIRGHCQRDEEEPEEELRRREGHDAILRRRSWEASDRSQLPEVVRTT
jgi:hypothetical protein